MMEYRNLLSLLLLTFLLFSCGKQDASGVRGITSIEEPDDQGDNSPMDVCYDGSDHGGKVCLQAFLSRDVIQETEDYNYINPHRDSSFPSTWDPSFYEAPKLLVDLHRADADDFIAQNFQVGEVMQARKGRYAYFSPYVAKNLQTMRSSSNRIINVNSAYRSPAYNATIDGSAKWSRHQYGDAVDLNIAGLTVAQMGDLCAAHNADFVLRYKTHIHCDWRWSAKLNDFPNNNLFERENIQFKVDKHIENLRQETKVVIVSGEPEFQSNISLTVLAHHHEDTEELLNDWIVHSPNGEKIEVTSTHLELENLSRGTYQIEAKAGGLIPVSYRLEVE